MISLRAQLNRIPEVDRPHVVRLTRSVLNQTLIDHLNDDSKENDAIRRTKGATLLAKAIESLNDEFPEADDVAPTYREVVYEAD